MDPHQWMLRMLIDPHERVTLAHLLRFLELSERLAHDCALAQAALAPEPGMRRFLLTQARQEAFHAAAFQSVTSWLVPRHLPPIRALGKVSDAHR